MNYPDIQEHGILFGIALIGVRFKIFEYLINPNVKKTDIQTALSINNTYLDRWLDSAIAYELIICQNGIYKLTPLGRRFTMKSENSQVANLIQGIFSTLLINESLSDMETGHQPGYNVVNQFTEISNFYNYVNQKKNDPLIEEIQKHPKFKNIIPKQGKILDFSCGNGWFLTKNKSLFQNNKLFGVSDSKDLDGEFTILSNEEFIKSQIKFDVIILNKVFHHIWDDNKLLESILSKLTVNGNLILWEFKWFDKIESYSKHREIVFLNLIEHIQKAEYHSIEEFKNKFESHNHGIDYFEIDDGKQLIYIINKLV